jgi:hypothetical protein
LGYEFLDLTLVINKKNFIFDYSMVEKRIKDRMFVISFTKPKREWNDVKIAVFFDNKKTGKREMYVF